MSARVDAVARAAALFVQLLRKAAYRATVLGQGRAVADHCIEQGQQTRTRLGMRRLHRRRPLAKLLAEPVRHRVQQLVLSPEVVVTLPSGTPDSRAMSASVVCRNPWRWMRHRPASRSRSRLSLARDIFHLSKLADSMIRANSGRVNW